MHNLMEIFGGISTKILHIGATYNQSITWVRNPFSNLSPTRPIPMLFLRPTKGEAQMKVLSSRSRGPLGIITRLTNEIWGGYVFRNYLPLP